MVEEEAERVRTIFRRYLALGSLNRLMADLRVRGVVTKVRSLKTGRTIGGIPFTRGPLATSCAIGSISSAPATSDLSRLNPTLHVIAVYASQPLGLSQLRI